MDHPVGWGISPTPPLPRAAVRGGVEKPNQPCDPTGNAFLYGAFGRAWKTCRTDSDCGFAETGSDGDRSGMSCGKRRGMIYFG